MAQTVIGIFKKASDAQDAVQELVRKGFNEDMIDVSASGSSQGTSGSTGNDYSTGGGNMTGSNMTGNDYSAGSGGMTGSNLTGNDYSTGSGGMTGSNMTGNDYSTGSGLTGGGLTGNDYSSGSNNLTGTNQTGNDYSRTGSNYGSEHKESGIKKFFRSLFGDDDDDQVSRYSTASEGRTVVTVHTQTAEESERAADILDDNGAIDVNENDNEYGNTGYSNTGSADMNANTGTTGVNMTSGTTDTDLNRDTTSRSTGDTDRAIPIVEEQLNVGKRTVQSGGVRLRSRIVERPVEESVRLREERVRVERNPVNRAATEADLTNFREGTVEITEQSEVPVVGKEARVVEEISLDKDVEEREETIRDTVRNTEVDIEELDKNRTNRQNNQNNF